MNCKVNSNITSRSIDPYTRNVPMTSYSKIIAIAAFRGSKEILDMLLNFKNWFITTDYTLIILVVSFLVYCEKQGKDDRDLKQCLDYCVGHRYNGYDISELLANGDGKNLYLYINSPLFKKLVYVAYGISDESKDKERKDRVDTLIKNLANRAKRVTQFLLLKSKVYGLIDLVFKYGKIDDLIGDNISKSRKSASQPPVTSASSPKTPPKTKPALTAPTPNPAPPPSSPSSSSAAPPPVPKAYDVAPPPPPLPVSATSAVAPPPSSSSAAPAPPPVPKAYDVAPPPPPLPVSATSAVAPPPSSSSAAPANPPKPAPAASPPVPSASAAASPTDKITPASPPSPASPTASKGKKKDPPPPQPPGEVPQVSKEDIKNIQAVARIWDKKAASDKVERERKVREQKLEESKNTQPSETLSALEKRRAARAKALKDMAKSNAEADGQAKHILEYKEDMVVIEIEGLEGAKVPYAAYHLYKQKMFGATQDGFVILPFPRRSVPDSYKIIKRILETVRTKTDSEGEEFNRFLHGQYESKYNLCSNLHSEYPELFLNPQSIGVFANAGVKIFTKIETGPNGALEPVPGLDLYLKDLIRFAKTVASGLIPSTLKINEDIYAPANAGETMQKLREKSSAEKFKVYSSTHGNTTLYLFTDEGEGKAKETLEKLFTKGTIEGYVPFDSDKYIVDIVINCTYEDKYLQQLPSFLGDNEIKNLGDVVAAATDPKALNAAAAAREEGKKKASEKVNEADEENYLNDINYSGFGVDFGAEQLLREKFKEIFKKFYPGQFFNNDSLSRVFEVWKEGNKGVDTAVSDSLKKNGKINTKEILNPDIVATAKQKLEELYTKVRREIEVKVSPVKGTTKVVDTTPVLKTVVLEDSDKNAMLQAMKGYISALPTPESKTACKFVFTLILTDANDHDWETKYNFG